MDESLSGTVVESDQSESGFARANGHDMSVVENLMAGGQMLPSQLPSSSDWTPERKLAASVLASALVEVRDHTHNSSYRKKIKEDLEWIGSEDTEYPFSFLSLCDLFGLESEWVREVVAGWLEEHPDKARRPITPYRQAA
jgi:hypothetical protein